MNHKEKYQYIIENFDEYTNNLYTLYLQNEFAEFSISEYFFFILNYIKNDLKINEIKDIYIQDLYKSYSENLAAKCTDIYRNTMKG